MATFGALVEDCLPFVGGTELHGVEFQFWMAALGAGFLDGGSRGGVFIRAPLWSRPGGIGSWFGLVSDDDVGEAGFRECPGSVAFRTDDRLAVAEDDDVVAFGCEARGLDISVDHPPATHDRRAGLGHNRP